MHTTKKLLDEIAAARDRYIASLSAFDDLQAQWKPSPESWNAVEITEHLFWAEQGGILGMWKVLPGIKAGTISYEGNSPNDGLSIEEIIRLTWKEKEIVPAIAAPRMGGPLPFWASALAGLQPILEKFGELLTNEDLLRKAHPHPISGAMTFGQRLAFLRFHIDRHRVQVENLQMGMADLSTVN
jgi:hypothetical protein